MARITVEDCTEQVPNRFELVVLAAKRGKDIGSGAPIFVSKDNDKNVVIALREIASKRLDIENLRASLQQSLSKDFSPSIVDDIKIDEQNEEDKKLAKDLSEQINNEMQTLEVIPEDEDFSFTDDDLDVED